MELVAGTLYKVIGNTVGHGFEIGEIVRFTGGRTGAAYMSLDGRNYEYIKSDQAHLNVKQYTEQKVKIIEASQSTSEQLNDITHTITPTVVENAVESVVGAASALSTQIDGRHYTSMAIQPLHYAMANNLNACQFNVVKYVSRYKSKNGRVDLEKAIHCLQVLIELEYGENK